MSMNSDTLSSSLMDLPSIECLVLSLPFAVNDLGRVSSFLLKQNRSPDFLQFLSDPKDQYQISSDQDALLALVHYFYNHPKYKIPEKFHHNLDRIIALNQDYHALKDKISGIYRKLGLECDCLPDVMVVDRFPKPFHNLNGRALAPDKTDQERYNLPNSMYLNRAAMRPVFTPILIAHELLHYHVRDDGLLCRGIEEAIADFLSVFLFGAGYISSEFAINYYCEMRYLRGASAQSFDLYVDDMVKLIFLIENLGWEKIAQSVRNGRKALKELDMYDIKPLSLSQINPQEDIQYAVLRVKNLWHENREMLWLLPWLLLKCAIMSVHLLFWISRCGIRRLRKSSINYSLYCWGITESNLMILRR